MKLTTAVFLFVSFISVAEAQSLKMHVNLSPAGSFDAVSDKLKGEAIKTKDGGVEAKKISILIHSLKTDIDLRDEHFWKHLDSTKHSKAVLSDVKGKGGKATGILEVAGVKKPVEINYEEKGSALVAHFQVKNSEYKLPAVNYMGVGVEDNITGEAVIPLKQ